MTMDLLSSLNLEMMRYYHNDPKRIQHFTKVHAYAKYIGTQEGLTSDTLFTLSVITTHIRMLTVSITAFC